MTFEAPLNAEANEKIRLLSQRSLGLATACLAVTALVLGLAMVGLIAVALSAQKDADDIQLQAKELNLELTCRSEFVTDHIVALGQLGILEAQLVSGIADGLIGATTDKELKELIDEIHVLTEDAKLAVNRLRVTGEARIDSVKTCESE